MGLFQRLLISDSTIRGIDWGMTPDLSFGTFESWGGRERIRNNQERICYFFIDNWGEVPKLCLMERGVKYAKVLAEIAAPPEMVKECVREQGSSSQFERSYAINGVLKKWLLENVVEVDGDEYVTPVAIAIAVEKMGILPRFGDKPFTGSPCVLPAEQGVSNDE